MICENFFCSSFLKIFVAFIIASVFGAPAPVPAPAPKPHYVSAGYPAFGYSAYSTPYIASPYVGAYASPYSYGYSPLGMFDILIDWWSDDFNECEIVHF